MRLVTSNCLFTEEKISETVLDLAGSINDHYWNLKPKEVTVIIVMDGAFMFASDLVRSFHFPINIKFLKTSSYGEGTQSSGVVEFDKEALKEHLNQHVLIIDDIFDTGNTIREIKRQVLEINVTAHVKSCCLFRKKLVASDRPDFYGLEVERDQFIYGYGLDLNGKERNLPYVAFIDN